AGVDCDLVGQVELARAAAGGAKRAERLAIRAEDLHAVVAGVDDQDAAGEADRDANRPHQIASAAPRRAELPEVVALAVEDLHAVVPVVGDVDALPGDGDAHWLLELAVPVAETAPLAQEDAAGVELLDAVVLRVGHVDVAVVVNCQRRRSVELAGAAACRAPYAEVLPGGREAPDAVADAVGQVDVARLEIDRDPGQHVVLTPVRPRVAQDVERDAGGREAGDRAGVVDLLLAVDCQDVAVLVDGDVHQRAETAAAGVADLVEEPAVAREFLDALVGEVGDQQIALAVQLQPDRPLESAERGAFHAPLGHKLAVAVEYLDAVVQRVAHVDVAFGVDRDAVRVV